MFSYWKYQHSVDILIWVFVASVGRKYRIYAGERGFGVGGVGVWENERLSACEDHWPTWSPKTRPYVTEGQKVT